MHQETQRVDYTIATVEVDPATLDKLDTKNSSRDGDGSTVRLPSQSNPCPLQLWEVYVAAAIVILQPPSSLLSAHLKDLCEHTAENYLCECLLTEHTSLGTVTDASQDTSFSSFCEEYLNRKFRLSFSKNAFVKYVTRVIDDPLCGRNGIARTFLLGPHLQAFLLNAKFWEGQYDELIDAMRMVGLPVNDVLDDPDADIGVAQDIDWNTARLYDDPDLILKKYGGWASSQAGKMMTPKDQLIVRLTGCSLDQLLQGVDVPDSPHKPGESDDEKEHAATEAALQAKSVYGKKSSRSAAGTSNSLRRSSASTGGTRISASHIHMDLDDDNSDDGSRASDYEVDPEHPKITPFGITLCEMYLLIRGLLTGLNNSDYGTVIARPFADDGHDGHLLAAAVLVDLYMRDLIKVHHWTLSDGNIAVIYRIEAKKGKPMDHFLDDYVPHAEMIFRNMRLPYNLSERPIWDSLEDRGVLDNHRPSWHWLTPVDVWDMCRIDVIADLRDGYVLAAQALYDPELASGPDSESNDVLMFVYVLQQLFDGSVEAMDGLARVMQALCPSFEKGELYPPLTQVHSGAVCQGIINRAFRISRGQDVSLASEAAAYNERIMERLEDTFFLSPSVWQAMDADFSGEITLEEFVEGMRGLDLYSDFRSEQVPEEVMRAAVSDLAEHLFCEVDVNADGTLTQEELSRAFTKRREAAQRKHADKNWVRRTWKDLGKQMGVGEAQRQPVYSEQQNASAAEKTMQQEAQTAQRHRKNEWVSEVNSAEFHDEDMDVDTAQALGDS